MATIDLVVESKNARLPSENYFFQKKQLLYRLSTSFEICKSIVNLLLDSFRELI